MLTHVPVPANPTSSRPRRLTLAVLLGLTQLVLGSESAEARELAPDVATTRFEAKFMQGMIDHHAMAVEMGEICLEEAMHEDLRNLCEQIIATQSRDIETMQSWLADRYGGVPYEPQMTRGDLREFEHLASLSGAAFEIAFKEMMIQHHEAAIRDAEDCLQRPTTHTFSGCARTSSKLRAPRSS